MPKDATVEYRSFTVRVPKDLYTDIADSAQGDGVNLNAKVNQLLRLGLGKHVSLDAALRSLLMERITTEEKVAA